MAKKKLSAKQSRKRLEQLLKPYRITRGKGFRLSQIDPGDSRGVKSREEAEQYLQLGIKRLAEAQDRLYAQDQWAVLLVFQAMDAAGKDGAIKHVMSGVNPQGCQVFAFKAPTSEELDHDFLWRTSKSLPERGRIGIFNRSYYEEVLVVKVHEAILQKQKLPKQVISKRIWEERYEDIRTFERYLARQGYLILKFFLHVSKKEQKERFLERLDRPEKNWKFSLADAQERGYWSAYARAYEEHDPRDRRAPRAVVRRARGQEVVHAARGGGRRSRSPRAARPHLPEGGRGEEEGAAGGARGARWEGKDQGEVSDEPASRGRKRGAKRTWRAGMEHSRVGLVTIALLASPLGASPPPPPRSLRHGRRSTRGRSTRRAGSPASGSAPTTARCGPRPSASRSSTSGRRRAA